MNAQALARRRSVQAAFILAVQAGVLFFAGAAAGQSSAVAEALFQKGRKLLTEGKVHEACETFAESQRVEPALGTELSMAACHEKEGKDATAWTEYQEVWAQAVRAGDVTRQTYARTHADAIEKRLHRIMLEVVARTPGIEVTLDHLPLGAMAWGTAIPLDPGEHVIDVTAPGRRPWHRVLVVGPGAGTDRIEVPNLDDAASEPSPAPPPFSTHDARPTPTLLTTAAPAKDTAEGAARVDTTKRTVGIVVGAVGVVGVGFATYAGFHAMSLASDRDALCPPGTACRSQQAFNLDHDAEVYQFAAIVSGIAGAAAVGAGAFLFLTSKTAPAQAKAGVHIAPEVGPHVAGIQVGGAF